MYMKWINKILFLVKPSGIQTSHWALTNSDSSWQDHKGGKPSGIYRILDTMSYISIHIHTHIFGWYLKCSQLFVLFRMVWFYVYTYTYNNNLIYLIYTKTSFFISTFLTPFCILGLWWFLSLRARKTGSIVW